MSELRKYCLAIGIILWSCGIVSAQVSFGIKGGIIIQDFGEESESEIWPDIGALIEYKLQGSPFGFRGDIGGGFHQKEEEIKTTKGDVRLGLGIKYLYEIATSAGVYGVKAPFRSGIYGGLGLGMHFYWLQEKYADSLISNSELGIGLRVFGGGECLISSYTLFGEIGWENILRGDIFQDERSWSQLVFTVGIRF